VSAGGKYPELNPFGVCRNCGAHGIHGPEVFTSIVNRERHRSDRNRHAFSLVVFNLGPQPCRGKTADRMSAVLAQTVRCTDEVGWVDAGDIGVMLPETQPRGAWRFADKATEAMRGQGFDPSFEIYSYPSATVLRGDREDHRQLCMESILEQAVEAVPSAPVRPPPFPMFDRYVPSAAGETEIDAEPGAGSADAIFKPPLPAWKRAFDVAGATAGLVLLSPLFLLIAVAIRLQSRGPAIFTQERVGRFGKTFRCFKFRTMALNSDPADHHRHVRKLIDADAPMAKLDDHGDPRLIPMGKLLRRSGLDELPQLVNVLKGDMSLIGPRPCIPYEYRGFRRWQRRRADAMPGMTGLWQVSGKNRTTFNEMMRLDIRYARTRSPAMDVTILLRTLPAIWVQMREGFVGQGRRESVSLRGRTTRAWRRGRETMREALRSPSAAAAGGA
jgi:lipopolysaccharide/colanic/teichoic acid biosynthesis glycosyltransferase